MLPSTDSNKPIHRGRRVALLRPCFDGDFGADSGPSSYGKDGKNWTFLALGYGLSPDSWRAICSRSKLCVAFNTRSSLAVAWACRSTFASSSASGYRD